MPHLFQFVFLRPDADFGANLLNDVIVLLGSDVLLQLNVALACRLRGTVVGKDDDVHLVRHAGVDEAAVDGVEEVVEPLEHAQQPLPRRRVAVGGLVQHLRVHTCTAPKLTNQLVK